MKNQNYKDDEPDSPNKVTQNKDVKKSILEEVNCKYLDAVRAGNIKDHVADNSKDSNFEFYRSDSLTKHTVGLSRGSKRCKVNVFGGNILEFYNF
jgi:hypothetical protein